MDQATLKKWKFPTLLEISGFIYTGTVGATILEREDGFVMVERWENNCPVLLERWKNYHFGVLVPEVIDIRSKPSNPKDLVGGNKVSMSCVPMNVIMEASLGLSEGMFKYGRHNYRNCGVRASIYYDALMRHMGAWWEGEDIDPDSDLSHVTKAISDLIVLRDSMLRGNWTDDRPPKSKAGWISELNTKFVEIKTKYKHMDPVHYFEVKQ